MIGGNYLAGQYLAGSNETESTAPTVQRINLWPIRQTAYAYARRATGQTLAEVLGIQQGA